MKYLLIHCRRGCTPESLPTFEALADAISAAADYDPEYDIAFVVGMVDGETQLVHEFAGDGGGCDERGGECTDMDDITPQQLLETHLETHEASI